MKTIKIYLADDDYEDRELFLEALSEIPLPTDVTQFVDGIDLMDRLFSDTTLPDIIFLDLHMPVMNGFECLNDIRNFPQFSRIIIIAYSSSYHQREVDQLREDGADHYLQKPDSFIQLKSLLFQSIKLMENTEDVVNGGSKFVILPK